MPEPCVSKNIMIETGLAKFQVDLKAFLRAQLEPALWFRDMGGIRSRRTPRVFGITYPQLGDHWVGLCHLVRFRRVTRLRHALALPPVLNKTTEERVSLVGEIARILQVEAEIELSDQPAELELPVHPARDGKTILWPLCRNVGRTLVAYQFDGLSHPHLNPSAEEIDGFLATAKGYPLMKVGRPLTLRESMEAIGRAKVFIGVSSGMSHLAGSANTPTLIYVKNGIHDQQGIEIYRHLKRWNAYRNTHFFSDVTQLKAILARYLNL